MTYGTLFLCRCFFGVERVIKWMEQTGWTFEITAKVDWAFFEDHLALEGGKWIKLYCFLMILGHSRMR